MHALVNSMQTVLDTSLTVGDFISWKLLWLCIRLEEHVGKAPELTKTAALVDAAIAERRLMMWEFNTIYDHPTDLARLAEDLPNWRRFDHAVNTLRTEARTKHLAEADRHVCGVLQIESNKRL